tara:strand:+ start:72 stop:1061 length:990 start_codon:yes stop_codon:yes gene_type:complete
MSENIRVLMISKNVDESQSIEFKDISENQLMDGDVLVKVTYSTLNYKDGLAITGKRPVVRHFPMIPGVDFSGIVEKSSNQNFIKGDRVVINGHGIGEKHYGGFAQKARVSGDWLIHLPENISCENSMALGSAGLTAMLSVTEIEKKIKPKDGEILVTGSSGGVGSIAIMLLSELGYSVVASTKDKLNNSYLTDIGASRIINRNIFNDEVKKLDRQKWAGVIDVVGSRTLAHAISQTYYGGIVVACGLAQGDDLPVSVMPFIIRAVTLKGIESIDVDRSSRIIAWKRLSEIMNFEKLQMIKVNKNFIDVIDLGKEIVEGKIKGRIVFKIN